MDIPASSIKGIRNRNNVFIGRRKFNPQKEEFIQIYNTLRSSVKVGEYYGVDHHAVIDYAKLIGYDYKFKDEISPDTRQYILDNYNHKSSTLLSKELNVKESTIRGIWYRSGLRGKVNRIYILDETVLDNIDSEEKAYFFRILFCRWMCK